MNTQEKIVEILKNWLQPKEESIIFTDDIAINDIAFEITPMIDKRDAIIEAQEKLVKWYKVVGVDDIPDRIIELRRKIEQLKSEI